MILTYKNGSWSGYQGSNQYNGDKVGGEFDKWKTYSPDANDFLAMSYGELSDRNATLYHTSAIARAAVNKPITYSIGNGLLFKSHIDSEMIGITKEAALDFSKQFTRLLHYEKTAINWYEKQPLAMRESKIIGDSLVYFLREENTGKPFDLIVGGGHNIDWEKSTSKITLGVEHDSFNRRVGIWRKGIDKMLPFVDNNGYQQIVQLLFKQRAGQMRGYGAYYSNIAQAKNIDRVWDAIIERMVQESMILGSSQASETDVKGQLDALAQAAKSGVPSSGDPQLQKVGGTDLGPGAFLHMKNGEGLSFTDLKTPSNNFGMANEWFVRMFAMATGVPPEVLKSEYSTSFTAHKGALNDFWKLVMQERSTFTRTVEDKINLEYLKHFARTGELKVVPGFWTNYRIQQAYLAGTYLGPVPGHINPLQEVKADEIVDKMGYRLKSDIAAKYGTDWDTHVDQWGEEQTKHYELSPENRAMALQEDLEARGEDGVLEKETKTVVENKTPKKKFFSLGRK